MEGAAVMVAIAIAIVIVVGSLNDWQKEMQFRALNEKKEDRTVKVMRSGSEKVINIKVRRSLASSSLLAHALTLGSGRWQRCSS